MSDDMNMQITITADNSTSEGFNAVDEAMASFQGLIDNVSAAFEAFTSSVNSGSSAMASAIEGITQPIENVSNELSSAFENSATVAEEQISKIGEGFTGVTEAATASADAMAAAYESAATASESAVSQIRPPTAAGEGEVVPGAAPGGNKGMMGSMGLTMAGGMIDHAIRPIKTGLESAVNAFAQFDQSMRMVNEETKLSQSGFKDLENGVISLSDQTGQSANDLSKGLYNIMATGMVDAAGGMKVLQVAAEGAKAGNASLDDTTQALDKVLGAYGMQADQVKGVLDQMFTATNDGQMHFADLARSVGASATSAAMAGVSYSELAASQATLTNVGKDAQLASQQLNSLIMGIIAPTSKA